MDNPLKKIYAKKKVLVTGHTGFKGGWLVLWLRELGADVIGYSIEPPTQPNFFDAVGLKNKITHIHSDIRSGSEIKNVITKYAPDFVFHLAAQPLVRFSYQEPKVTYETNVLGCINILEGIRQASIPTTCLIITSDKCYENISNTHSFKETDPLGGYDPYSSSKACAEIVVAAYRRSFFNADAFDATHNVNLSSVRAGNVIGGGDWGEDRIVPDCMRALSRNAPIVVRNPNAIRPWQYVLEPLSGYLLLGALMREKPTQYNEAWNFGPQAKSAITVKELIELIIAQWGNGSFRHDTDPNPHEAKTLRLNIEKAKKRLRWQPLCTIEEALQKTVAWYKRYYEGVDTSTLYAISTKEIAVYTECMNQTYMHAHTL